MSEKAWKRLKITLIILGVLLFTGYFAFLTFVFNPLEGAFGEIANVVPRNVEFFIRKKDLSSDFKEFPEPKFFEALSQSDSWARFLRSQEFLDFDQKHHFEAQIEEMRKNLNSMPIDVLGDLIGREVVVAGRKGEGQTEITEFALFTRVSWKVKAGLGLMRYNALRGRFAPQLNVEEGTDGILKVSGAAPRDMYLWRDRDLLVVGSNPWFLRQAQQLANTQGEGSLGLSAKYYDEIQRFRTEANEFEIYLSVEDYAKRFFGPNNWPVIQWDLFGRLLAELIKPEAFKESLNVLRVTEDIWLRLHLNVNGDALTDFQRRFYDSQPINLTQEIMEKGKWVPTRSFLYGAIACDVGELFRAAERSFDEHQRRLVSDQLKSVGPYRDVKAFIDEFAPAFRRNVFFMARRNDYPKVEGDPPNDGMPDPVWALILSVKTPEKANDLVKYFINNWKSFGVEQTFYFDVSGGYRATEFFSQLVPGTGEIALLPAGETFYISNSPKYLKEILKCRFSAGGMQRLGDESSFQEALKELEPAANMFFYLNSVRYKEVFDQQIPWLAKHSFRINYTEERNKAQDKIIREKFPGYRGKALPKDVKDQVERLVDIEINNLEATTLGPGIEKARKSLENYGVWLSSFPFIYATIRTDHKKFELNARISVDWK